MLAPVIRHRAPNEAETEAQLVFPVLEKVLGWPDWLPQQNQSKAGRSDVPDALLFADALALERARPELPWQRFQHGLCLVESKRWNRPLDRPADSRTKQTNELDVPSIQILRYLRRADDVTRGELRWGILIALEQGRRWEEKVARDLSRIVFDQVFPARQAET